MASEVYLACLPVLEAIDRGEVLAVVRGLADHARDTVTSDRVVRARLDKVLPREDADLLSGIGAVDAGDLPSAARLLRSALPAFHQAGHAAAMPGPPA